MNSQVEKVTMYSGNGKNPMVIPEGKHPITETDLSSNNVTGGPRGHPQRKHSKSWY